MNENYVPAPIVGGLGHFCARFGKRRACRHVLGVVDHADLVQIVLGEADRFAQILGRYKGAHYRFGRLRCRPVLRLGRENVDIRVYDDRPLGRFRLLPNRWADVLWLRWGLCENR